MAGKLTQEEANELLEMLKITLSKEINFPEKGTSTEFDVKGKTNKTLFTIKIYRGRINLNKYEIGARIKKENLLLLELHVNPGNPHTNPDGQKIIGSHWHIYNEDYYRSYAFPAEDVDSKDFVINTMLFFEKFNLIDPPTVNYQQELFS